VEQERLVVKCAKPILKWPGGKRFLAPELRRMVPGDYRRYIEPFFGGGAMFFSLAPRHALVGDVNSLLIDCYEAIKTDHGSVYSALRRLKNSKRNYYKVRSSKPRSMATNAARLIYLMTLSFNGIYRVNKQGQFNVPYGFRSNRKLPNLKSLSQTADALRAVKAFHRGDFADLTKVAKEKDLIYLDPPYHLSSPHGFRGYNGSHFSMLDHERLAAEARRLSKLGAYVFISSSSENAVEDLYKGFRLKRIRRRLIVGAATKSRKIVEELLFSNV
jgi:DNA adenine methylase